EHDRLLFYPAGYEGLENSRHVVYLGGTPNQTVIPLVRWAYVDAGKRNFFLLGSDDVYSHIIAHLLKNEITRLRGTVTGESYVQPAETNFADIVKQIQQSKADMIINSSDGQSNFAFARALRRDRIRPAAVPTAWLSIGESELSHFDRSDDLVGDYSAACYFASLPRSENREFLKRFSKRFPGERVNDVMQTAY